MVMLALEHALFISCFCFVYSLFLLIVTLTMTAIGRRPRSLLLSIVVTISLLLHRNDALSASAPTEFRILSWNLLAPMFAPAEKYRYSDPDCLPWSYRQPRILARLKAWNPDIICLQEMQLDLWDDFLAQMEGYQGVIQKEKSSKRDLPVNAVLVRDGCAEIVRTESRSRALIVVLKPTPTTVIDEVDEDGDHIFLANVHLEAGFDRDETRYFQIRSLMKQLEKQVLLDKPDHGKDVDSDSDSDSDNSEPAVILAGDFNMFSTDDIIYDLLTIGHLPDDDDGDDILVADTLPEPFLPLLPLRDAYRQCPPVPGPVLMTYRGGAVLDYIWLSSSFTVQETWQAHPVAAKSLRRTWPNPNQPSDHLPVGAVLSRQYNKQ
jgi:CCR4-NOT transcription complex subunit 6